MNPRIIVPHGETSVLAGLLGVSMPTVRNALRGSSHTVLSASIRELALARGGVQVRVTRKGTVCVYSTEKTSNGAAKQESPKNLQREEKTMKAFLMYLAEINGIKIIDLE